MKRKCAQEALSYIHDHSIIGLGGGQTIGYLIEYLAEKKLDIKVVSPSYETAQKCVEHGLLVVPTWSVDRIDIAFDGCDEVDQQLNALKSGGAIHTKEKIIASMADQYVLLVDASKVFEQLPFDHSVTLEVIPESVRYVKKEVEKLGATLNDRKSAAKDGVTISDHGMFILEAKFTNVDDISRLDQQLKNITGIVDTSLFVGKVSFALVAQEDRVAVLG